MTDDELLAMEAARDIAACESSDMDGYALRLWAAGRDYERAQQIPPECAMIATERLRQINVEGWTPEHDDHHDQGELASAAAAYARGAVYGVQRSHPVIYTKLAPPYWPWDEKWWKPSTPIRMLVKAGALIAAEIARRLRRGETA